MPKSKKKKCKVILYLIQSFDIGGFYYFLPSLIFTTHERKAKANCSNVPCLYRDFPVFGVNYRGKPAIKFPPR